MKRMMSTLVLRLCLVVGGSEGTSGLEIVSNFLGKYPSSTGTALLSADWVNLICEVGQVFPGGADEFRTALKKYAIKVGFEF